MVRTREELTKFFSDEIIDHEVDRVKDAKEGEMLYFMDTWENSDFVDSILSYAEISFSTEEDNKTRYYIKGEKSQA